MDKYRIYVDEVGNPDLENSDNPNHRFLSLTGVIIKLDYVASTLQPQLESLKKEFFDAHPDEPFIFHRKELLGARYPFTVLKDGSTRERFDKKLLSLFLNWDYQVITVCIDKKVYKETYSTWRHDPYHYCLAVMLERYVFFLDTKNACGDVMAESRGGKEDRRLKNSFTGLYHRGTEYISSERFSTRFTSCQLKVKNKSNNIAGLQLADLLAHPSRNEILVANNHKSVKLRVFGSKIVDILQEKYYRKGTTVYGKKMLP
ncbi:DUF3800 domain-containing protein [Planctomycetota bacterium]